MLLGLVGRNQPLLIGHGENLSTGRPSGAGVALPARRRQDSAGHKVAHDTRAGTLKSVRASVTTWYLEMVSPEQLRPARCPELPVEVTPAEPDPALSRYFYTEVGRGWWWVDRLGWTDEQWRQWVERPGYEILVARSGSELVGYLELDEATAGNVEIAHFGLLPAHVGKGAGGHVLTAGVRRAWERGASRVWLHTCSLDAPSALPNYEARGFRIYDRTDEEFELDEPRR